MRCHKCGEPWDLDSLHEEISDRYHLELNDLREKYKNDPRRYRSNDPFQKIYEEKFFIPALEEFRKNGCRYFGLRCENETLDNDRRNVLFAIDELMGDDVDGIESAIEDAEMLGLL